VKQAVLTKAKGTLGNKPTKRSRNVALTHARAG
jgi:hypothetical protein